MEPKQLGRARCPYCEKKVNLMVAWGLRRRGEYRCPRCNGISNVTHSRLLLPLALCAIGVSGLILLLTLFLLEPATGWSVLLVLAPFLVFYIFSLCCVQLKKPVIRRGNASPEPSAEEPRRPETREEMDQTRIL